MEAAPLPANDAARLSALESYDILDTAREQAYDDFTALAAAICGTPIALISLIDRDRQWFKSELGLGVSETPRDRAFCAHTIIGNQTLIVPDATRDARFHDNPLVLGSPDIRFYAGAPLVTDEGYGLGTLCVIDRVLRTLSPQQIESLEALSRQLMTHLNLRRAMIALRETEHAKKKFVAHVSHELRTPLTSIRGALALVLDAEPNVDEDSRELLAAAHRNANRLLALVNDLLDLERVGSGELSVEKKDCKLSAVLDRAADTVRSIAADARVALKIAPTRLGLHADPDRLTQVMINLLANAVRFSPRGGAVTVTAEPHGENLHVIVDDQGPGLGLTISQAIIKEHGGWIVVGDAPGGGARFTVGLPVSS
jgi:signal transduction histidine kinase